MKTPDLSFVIPAYNAEAFLAEAIGSCLAQSHKTIEVVVVDDGSEDATGRIAKFYADKDPRCRLVSPGRNLGRGKARNFGNSQARAKFIAVLDADDLSAKDRAERTLKFFKEHPSDVLYSPASIVDSVSSVIGRFKTTPFNFELSIKEGSNYIVHSTMAYSAELARRFPYDEAEYAEAGLDDWLFQIRLAKAGIKMIAVEETLSAWRIQKDSVTQNRNNEKVKSLKDKELEPLREQKQKIEA